MRTAADAQSPPYTSGESIVGDSGLDRSATRVVAKSIQKNLQAAAAEWNQSQNALERERERFEKVCRKLDEAVNLRGVHWYVLGTLAACVAALLIGHYVWHH